MLSRNSVEVGCAVLVRDLARGPVVASVVEPELAAVSDRAADHRAAVHASVGSASDRVLSAVEPINGRRVLTRFRMPLLQSIDQVTGLPVRRDQPVRYEKRRPGELVHMDVKKLGQIPDGGGWRARGRGSAQDRKAHVVRTRSKRSGAASSRGYRYLHHVVNDHLRLAFSEIHPGERTDTVIGFWNRPWCSSQTRASRPSRS